jgi:hypothetical protein
LPGAETYVQPDPQSGALVERTEEMLASWSASPGTFDEPHAAALPTSCYHRPKNRTLAPRAPGLTAV